MPRKKDEENIPLIEPHQKGKKFTYTAFQASILPKKTPIEFLPTTEKNFFFIDCFKKKFRKDFPLDDFSDSLSRSSKIFKTFRVK